MRKALALVLLAVFWSGCSGAGKPPAVPATLGQRQLAPEVWQRGTPPVHWQIFRNPITVSPVNNQVYSWPVKADSGHIAFGVTFQHAEEDEPINARLYSMNMSGSVALVKYTDSGAPFKLFACADETQVCYVGGSHARYVVGPDNQSYYGGGQEIADATGGPHKAVWFTTCCQILYIVRGQNGTTHFFRVPNPRDFGGPITVASDGNVWTYSSSFEKLDPLTSKVTVYPLQLATMPQQLLSAGDAIWFAVGKTLYRMNEATAAITRLPLSQPASGYLTTGPRNTIWLGYNAATTRGLFEFSQSGALLGSFQCPSSVCNPGAWQNRMLGMTTGPDGNIWFAFSDTDITDMGPHVFDDNTTEGIGVYVIQSMNVSPSAVTLPVGQRATITFSEANYTGTFTAASTAPGIAGVVRFLTPHQVVIQALVRGSARIIIRDSMNNYFGVPVTVK